MGIGHSTCTVDKMFSLVLAALFVFSGVLARNEPSPGDPDTYPYDYIKWEEPPGVIITEDLRQSPEDISVSPEKIKIYFFSKNHPDNGILIDMNDPVSSLRTTDFKKSRPTTFVIHGWKNSKESPVCVLVKNAIVQRENAFVVDWSEYSKKNYVTARLAVPDVGRIVGNFIKTISVGSGLHLDTTRVVGHSLGAHVSGFAGKTLESKLNTIVGLDPAWPLFYFSRPTERLAPIDASFVEVVHTNGYLLGFPYSIGHADFYPNGGKSQPGCFLDVSGACAHARAYQYYEESLRTGHFIARQCDSYSHYKNDRCNQNPTARMGEYYTDKTAFKDFYLDTNSASPFAKGG